MQRNLAVGAGVIGLGLCAFFYPMFAVKTNTQISSKQEEPLPRQAAVRGQYINSGSRDIGLDVPLKDFIQREKEKKDKKQ
ncbi:hypothetical protein PROFUN_12577 [Planoprotostelium fungivorum]|uniref:Uncharacterized protein n=1 Tax=Planoprotostelium fungivorum TaxID=1890364 RepID=A0A2P6N6V0_9EUKA|nr:hypothetical protein PROFUN_12577 [Planoprotostelium fungivorum]